VAYCCRDLKSLRVGGKRALKSSATHEYSPTENGNNNIELRLLNPTLLHLFNGNSFPQIIKHLILVTYLPTDKMSSSRAIKLSGYINCFVIKLWYIYAKTIVTEKIQFNDKLLLCDRSLPHYTSCSIIRKHIYRNKGNRAGDKITFYFFCYFLQHPLILIIHIKNLGLTHMYTLEYVNTCDTIKLPE